ncbi:MAG: ATP-binding protein [Acidobacteriaceae bacterium]
METVHYKLALGRTAAQRLAMQLFYKRFGVITGFLLLLGLLVFNAIVTQRQLSATIEHQTRVENTQEVLLAVNQTQSLLEDAETGELGYLYTTNPQYLNPYMQAVGELGPQFDLLARMTARHPQVAEQVQQLRGLVGAKLEDLASTILLYQSGYPAEARQMMVSGHAHLLSVEINNLIGQILLQETSLETERTESANRSVRHAYLSIDLATLIAILGLCFLAYSIFRTMALRDLYAHQLQEREEWFRTTLTSMGDAVVATDKRGRVTFVNSMAERLIGRSSNQAIGRAIAEVFPLFHETTGKPIENPFRKVMEQNFVVGAAGHALLEHQDGSRIPIDESAAPIRDAQGDPVGMVIVFRDATQERKSQEVLRKTEKLAAAARLAATVSHEINNPLEAIGNLVYIAKTTENVPEAAVAHLAMAEEELIRVSHITRQTLGFYRESKMPEKFDLTTLVESVLNIYSNKFRTKSIRVERELAHCPLFYGLSGELNQAVANLISNAADAVPNGGSIRVGLTCRKESGEDAVYITIQDDGPGIADEHRERIFEPFFTTKKDVGTGLGLWVAKEIIERHGGRLEVESRTAAEDHGTTFTITLPVRPELDSFTATEISAERAMGSEPREL